MEDVFAILKGITRIQMVGEASGTSIGNHQRAGGSESAGLWGIFNKKEGDEGDSPSTNSPQKATNNNGNLPSKHTFSFVKC